ncbi:Late embryoproteinsis abundant (LEA) hydroxyproline-rich glycoprotein family [Hibiscus syriacus]|uniref:Late embryoproteinsis abundant (LEA) hydroxyproline-rich glycoprotein family n=1 Tax=Hibiscus syriacus TaxID=106335 RepID=A0A6A2WTB0_HIBSY|nr:protein NDR1-like [Hibiscus syriacus]KAE8664483.1 Late embryoproteinsis abundant (LEA) hydroxyproline-rich glycoprotein family [Hibiscus syriacus]
MCETKSFYLWLLQVVGLLGLLAFCLWLALRPRSPTYTIVNFSVLEANDSNASDHGTIHYELDIENPNEDSGIYYDDILLMFYYGEDKVGSKTIPSFYQGWDRTHRVIDQVDVETRLWTGLHKAMMNATAELRADLSTKVKYKTWGIKSKHHGMNKEGKIRIGKDGKISNKKKKVKLGHPSKKWKLRSTRYLSSIILNHTTEAQQSSYVYHFCPNTTNFSISSTYRTNRDSLLSSLSSNVTGGEGFYNTTSSRNPDMVYGLYGCLGDLLRTTAKRVKPLPPMTFPDVVPLKKRPGYGSMGAGYDTQIEIYFPLWLKHLELPSLMA